MPKSRVGLLGVMLCLLSACSSKSSGDVPAASGTAGSSGPAGSSGASSNGGGPAHGGSNSAGSTSEAGSTSGSGGTAGKVIVGEGGASDGGTENADSGASGSVGASGGAQNTFINQLVLTQAGAPSKCLPIALPVGLPNSENDGRVSCFIAELKPGPCDCSQTARAALPASVLTATKKQMQANGSCDGDGGVSCDALCVCEIDQTLGVATDPDSALYACQNDLTVAAGVDGFCLVDQSRTDANGAPAPLGNPALVSQCPSNEKRTLRFVGAGQPVSGATAFLGCTE